jgi:hypothetical protein
MAKKWPEGRESRADVSVGPDSAPQRGVARVFIGPAVSVVQHIQENSTNCGKRGKCGL